VRRTPTLIRALVAVIAVMLAGAAPATSADPLMSSCTPTMNGPGTLAPGSVIAPYLRVLKSSYSIGDCDSTISPTARSVDGTIWGVDQGNAKNGLWKSTDDLATWQLAYQAAGYACVEEVLPLVSGHLLIVVRDSNGIRHILRSTTASGTVFAMAALDLPAGALLHDPQSWVEYGGAIYVAEYGDAAAPIMVWKSIDDGQTFSVAFSRGDVRHYHSIQPDTYQPGRLWLDAGDTGSEPRIGYSDDGAATFSWITEVTYPRSRALDMMFAPDAVYWGTDVPEEPSSLYRWDRGTGAISTILKNLNGPFYNTFSANGVYAQFSAIERPASDGYIGDEYIHVLTSAGGSAWAETKTPFMRTPGDTGEVAYMTHFTPPDSQGRFWGSFFDLEGTQWKHSNIEFQLDPTATFNGVRASFTATPTSQTPGTAVSFDASASTSPQPPLSYDWDFGDGSTATGQLASHAYSAAGTYTVRLQVRDGNGDESEARQQVTIANNTTGAPSVTTNAASSVTTSGATLNGNVTPNGLSTTAHFEYGTTTAYGSVTADQSAGSGGTAVALSAPLSGLSPGTTYHYRLVASSVGGATQGADATFTTASLAPPAVTTSAASGVTMSGATLNGSANPNGSSTTAHFEYGTTTAYGSVTADQSAGSGGTAVALSAPLSGLSPGTTYHYRLVATSVAGTSQSADRTFTTASLRPPTVSTSAAAKVTYQSATLRGSVNPQGSATTAHFEFGTTTAYGSVTADQSAGSGTTALTISTAVAGLTANTTYHYRIVATNAGGTSTGGDRTFTTGPLPPVVTTASPLAVGATTAMFAGTVNPGGGATTYYFQYGRTLSYGSRTTKTTLAASTADASVTANATSLLRATVYHVRLVATNSSGTTYGADVQFRTTS
jgi:hypothetical protein